MAEFSDEDIAALEAAIRAGEIVNGTDGLLLSPEAKAEVELAEAAARGVAGSAGGVGNSDPMAGMRDWEFEQLVDPSIRLQGRVAPADVMAAGRRLAEEHGERLTQAIFHGETKVSRREIRMWFGSFTNFRAELGLRPNPAIPESGPTEDEMLAAFEELLESEGEGLTAQRYYAVTGWNNGLVARRFGSFGKLRMRFGLGRRAATGKWIATDELLEDALRVWRELAAAEGEDVESGLPSRRFPTTTEYDRFGRFCTGTIYGRFGKWRAAETAVREAAAGDSPLRGDV